MSSSFADLVEAARMKSTVAINAPVALTLSFFASTSAQDASQNIALRAYLKSSVRLSQESLAPKMRVSEGGCTGISLPLEIAWYVDQMNSQIQIIAFFSDGASALKNSSGQVLAAPVVEARIGNSPWKSFPGHRPPVASSGLLLTTMNLNLAEPGRQARRHTQIEFRVCGLPPTFVENEYYGRVDLRTIIR